MSGRTFSRIVLCQRCRRMGRRVRMSAHFPSTARTPMRKNFLVFFPLFFLLTFGSAQEQDYSKVQIKVTKVAGNIYMLEGSDAGNIGASVGEDGIVIVDDQYA